MLEYKYIYIRIYVYTCLDATITDKPSLFCKFYNQNIASALLTTVRANADFIMLKIPAQLMGVLDYVNGNRIFVSHAITITQCSCQRLPKENSFENMKALNGRIPHLHLGKTLIESLKRKVT